MIKTLLLLFFLFSLFLLGNYNTVYAVVADCTNGYDTLIKGSCQPTCDGGTWSREDNYSGYPAGNPNYGGTCSITSFFKDSGCTQSASQPTCQSSVAYCDTSGVNYPCTGAGGVCANAARSNDDICRGLQLSPSTGGPGNFCYRATCGLGCNSSYQCATVYAQQSTDMGGVQSCTRTDPSSPYYCAAPTPTPPPTPTPIPPPPAPTGVTHSCGLGPQGPVATINWNPSDGASSYEIHIRSYQVGDFVNTTTTSTSYSTRILTGDTNYVQLYAVNPNANPTKGSPAFYWFSCGGSGGYCNDVCHNNTDCLTNYCLISGSYGYCRNPQYPYTDNCQAPPPPNLSSCNGVCNPPSIGCQSGLTCFNNSCRNPQNLTSTSCAAPTAGVYNACGFSGTVWTAGGYTPLQPSDCPGTSQFLSITQSSGYLLPICSSVPTGMIKNADGCGFSAPAANNNPTCASLPANACNAQCPCTSGNCSI